MAFTSNRWPAVSQNEMAGFCKSKFCTFCLVYLYGLTAVCLNIHSLCWRHHRISFLHDRVLIDLWQNIKSMSCIFYWLATSSCHTSISELTLVFVEWMLFLVLDNWLFFSVCFPSGFLILRNFRESIKWLCKHVSTLAQQV